jgi:N-acetylglucosaminyldiphosphoundecaprenol N-acetyl-beta-D-mannosaminyltransferase
METIDVLGVQIRCLDQAGLIDQAIIWSSSPGVHTITYANAHTLNQACQDASYRDLLSTVDLIYADGVSLMWSSRLFGGCRLIKLTGADWIDPLAARAASTGVSLYLLGGRPNIARRAAQRLLNRHASLVIAGVADGYFLEKSVSEVADEISALRPGLVLVGMGCPAQEYWIAQHFSILQNGVWWGVGALLDYLAGAEKRAPRWFDRLGLEWLWRLAQDPSGKWRRYILGNPIFVYRIMRQYLNHRHRLR